ncbi:unnamed protein product [Rotaria magnacalcarata]|uniref:Uncharacterized protein n=1 Tax=Rotaria magnacalcarata TaxID=392030 RepID=A0A814TFM6_9BILA|nr:unnamed protein product [Rotaria magnacalcarata]CAF1686653.1 unnamed protein product [Rotaria magnacalcarata]CAF1922363.1 unnamed protein product [Rotaria magnacalcarata]CAF3927405.1 unnamed protein product [Rotaria magnacalcarata]CAF3984043.1 unnamed protein product [Rotaria magnacalcarata]
MSSFVFSGIRHWRKEEKKRQYKDIDNKLSFYSLVSRRILICIRLNASDGKQTFIGIHVNPHSMNDFTVKVNRLIERLDRDIKQCDHIERRACLVDEHLFILNQSIKMLVSVIDVSYLMLISSDKEKLSWLQLIDNINVELTNAIVQQFIYRLELYLRRPMIDNNEKWTYIEALRLLQSPFIVSSSLLLNMKEEKKKNNK